jgi:hypothetical protein
MLVSEADVLRTLDAGTYTLDGLYELCERRAWIDRDGGQDPVPDHPGDRRWKRRVRGALQALPRSGRAARIARSSWAIEGTATHPTRLLLIVAGAEPREFELRLRSAVALLAELEEPVRPRPVRPAVGAAARPGTFRRWERLPARPDTSHRRLCRRRRTPLPRVHSRLGDTRGRCAQTRRSARGDHRAAARRGRPVRRRGRRAELGDLDRRATRVPARHAPATRERPLDHHRPVTRRASKPQARVQPAAGPASGPQRSPLPARLVGGR